MPKVNKGLVAGIVIAAAAFLYGLTQVVLSPLEQGDVYPAYSSLRSDPLGARVLYESLATLPELTVERHYKARAGLRGVHATIFFLGIDPTGWSGQPERSLAMTEELLSGGGRLVIGFLPVRVSTPPKMARPAEERWGIKLHYRPVPIGRDENAIPRETSLAFELTDPAWKPIYVSGVRVLAAERPLAGGSVVLVADSFLLSNEGLRLRRQPELLAAIVGPNKRVIFDEYHFGVRETGSVAQLARKYRLEGAVAVLLLIAALFLWRASSSFLPPREPAVPEAVAGRDSVAGLVSLFRRGVPPHELLAVCVAQWKKSAAICRSVSETRRSRAESDAHTFRDPVEGYRAVHRILSKQS